MHTKIAIAATVALLSLATTAFAGEGNGNPFPFRAATTQPAFGAVVSADVGSEQMPVFNPALSSSALSQATLPENGSQGEVASVNSLPSDASVGTVQYARAEQLDRWFSPQSGFALAARRMLPNG